MTATWSTAGDYRIVPFKVEHGVNANGYAFVELPRPGRFDVETARSLGVPEGPLFGRLQAGETVELPDGGEVRPEQVLGPPRPGRRIVFAGDTAPAASVLEVAKDADVLVHEATFAEEERERADETAHSTAAGAAGLAAAQAVRLLALTHLQPYFGPRSRGRHGRSSPRQSFRGTSISSTSGSRSGAAPDSSRAARE